METTDSIERAASRQIEENDYRVRKVVVLGTVLLAAVGMLSAVLLIVWTQPVLPVHPALKPVWIVLAATALSGLALWPSARAGAGLRAASCAQGVQGVAAWHRVRNGIASIRSTAELAMDHASPAVYEYLEDIVAESERCNALVSAAADQCVRATPTAERVPSGEPAEHEVVPRSRCRATRGAAKGDRHC